MSPERYNTSSKWCDKCNGYYVGPHTDHCPTPKGGEPLDWCLKHLQHHGKGVRFPDCVIPDRPTSEGEWWCPSCRDYLDWQKVTYYEKCANCGTKVQWHPNDRPISKPPPTDGEPEVVAELCPVYRLAREASKEFTSTDWPMECASKRHKHHPLIRQSEHKAIRRDLQGQLNEVNELLDTAMKDGRRVEGFHKEAVEKRLEADRKLAGLVKSDGKIIGDLRDKLAEAEARVENGGWKKLYEDLLPSYRKLVEGVRKEIKWYKSHPDGKYSLEYITGRLSDLLPSEGGEGAMGEG